MDLSKGSINDFMNLLKKKFTPQDIHREMSTSNTNSSQDQNLNNENNNQIIKHDLITVENILTHQANYSEDKTVPIIENESK